MSAANIARLENVVRRAGDISTLPRIAMRIIEMTNAPNTRVADLELVIEADPALTTRVLRTVNSSAFALREKVTTLHQAITYLGFQNIRNLTTALSVSKFFKEPHVIGTYDRSALWHHLVTVGLCSRMVASHCHIESAEDIYLAGLLHDIGIILADQHDHKLFVKLMSTLREGVRMVDQERALLGYDHTQLGSRVAKAWKLPEFIISTIRFHHASQACRDEYARVAQCVEVANFICTFKNITSVGKKLCRPAPEAFQALDLSKEDLAALGDKLDHVMEENQELYEIA